MRQMCVSMFTGMMQGDGATAGQDSIPWASVGQLLRSPLLRQILSIDSVLNRVSVFE